MRQYLLGRSIIIYTDHCPLCNMMTSSVKNRRVDRISILLQEFNIEKIIHIKGRHNRLADYLSRHPTPREEEIFDEDYGISMLFQGEPPVRVYVPDHNPLFISAVNTRSKTQRMKQQNNPIDSIDLFIKNDTSLISNPDNVEYSQEYPLPLIMPNKFDLTQIKIEQSKDLIIQKKIKEIMQNPTKHPYAFKDGLLYKFISNNRDSITKKKFIYLPSSMIDALLKSYHDDPLGGHFGIKRTYFKIKNKFW
ncbi:unnamed protein product [Rotaria magnacalcarata]|uniref:Uncharacterized protein n=1 Tax=Rotaria magnacalcarata TaxID=392030 RepID=A0A815SHP1_9BILA|nr:unnamed protein product [Rotaria magnacalcarata]CAF4065421.1 unnamed protein product [Rotaria magnacalcarata]